VTYAAVTGDRVSCVFSKNPTVVVLVSFFHDAFVPRSHHEQDYYEEAVRRGMKPLRIMRYAPDYYLWVFWNPQSEPNLATLEDKH
jgi:hypothetical protein